MHSDLQCEIFEILFQTLKPNITDIFEDVLQNQYLSSEPQTKPSLW